ncbi:MAG TPA: hypothetical protein VF483_04085, partial [Gemmatimonadaceae bacterium]
ALPMLVSVVAGCTNVIVGGPLGEGAPDYPDITAVDSTYPPRNASIKLDKDAYTVMLLVAPGHSATLLYPKDSSVDNHLTAGTHSIAFQVPGPLVLTDSFMLKRTELERQRYDSAARIRARMSSTAGSTMPPLSPNATTYLLVVTSPQPLTYARVFERTAGWSIPLDDMEALNAVAKQVKSTITKTPKDWSGAYHVITLTAPKK